MNVFAASEIVELGVQIEKNGRDFYNAVAEKSKDKKAKDIFEYLAAEEEKHIAVFQKILNSVEKYQPSESYPGEYFAYMNALASDHVFTKKNKGEDVAKKTKSDKEAVEIGIGAEKDSIIFYEGMKKVVPRNDHSLLEQLIAEEQAHLTKLSELKNTL